MLTLHNLHATPVDITIKTESGSNLGDLIVDIIDGGDSEADGKVTTASCSIPFPIAGTAWAASIIS
ncbi:MULTISPECIES: hypothetical protein [unclassified Rhizobium]|uniref:hypothetical protein n=1 Tax=unclassified Rhizobium TaxID=2613769 RepID=UPI001ADB2D5B|nr:MULTISPECIES: hypothetical protein [unclassified Rhizobium]MBO9100833.1 hypothetical protein [Rhizobium sp. L58/93]MBO9170461.1 hypothetical protein [Rhizobium sp. L245/93]MBO9186386.1 hypothetical protein [Rhizobium sp. E27B/91]QXZ86293.1 hypothetical protein J5287_24870 [Rhizobium sp. K1/93]QXZ92252.1 hypothetical protein J5280_24315 [Rhizobium sp. K15/93]